MRKTKIVATVGPACDSEKLLTSMMRIGVDMFRINASHSSPEDIRRWIKKIRKVSKDSFFTPAIMVDLQGPRIRTGSLENQTSISLKKGSLISILCSTKPGFEGVITTLCRQFSQMVKAGDRVLIDNGLMELEVVSVKKNHVKCRVIVGGILGENKGINLPYAPVTLPALSKRDYQNLSVAAEMKVDYVALSFVRSVSDIQIMKRWFKQHHYDIPIIAKIEKPRAVDYIQSIIKESDGIMVARGDLGIEMGVEKVPVIQKEIIHHANRRCIPVITATQMLESMIENSRPTRAEASDIANAVFDGTDAVMLSGETAIGKHPLKAVEMMSKIIQEAEHCLEEIRVENPFDCTQNIFVRAIVHAARHAAKDLGAKAILAFTRLGKTAVLLSKFRPLSPIIALTPGKEISARLSILRGIYPLEISYQKNIDAMIRQATQLILRCGIVKKGDPVVVLSGKHAFPETRYMTQIHRAGEF